MKKKNAIIIILIAVILVIGILLFLYFRDDTNNTQGNNQNTGTLTFPTSGNDTIFGNDDENVDTTQNIVETKVADIRQIFAEPVSGAIVLETSSSPKVRFVERSNGHIHENILDSKEVIRISNTTIPKIQEVLWGKDGKTLIYRYIKDNTNTIETFSGKLKLSTSTSNEISGEVTGTFLPTNIKTISINKNTDTIIYTQDKTSGEGTSVFVSNTDGSSKRQVADLKFKEISFNWQKNGSALLFTKPSYKYNGFVYEMSINNGSLSKIIGDLYGLIPNQNSSMTKILYSNIVRGVPSLKLFELSGSIETDLSVSTFADKCVWSNISLNRVYCAVPKSIPSGLYPDSWYQGIVSFSDNIWEVDLENGSTKIVAEIKEDEFGKIDITDPIISKDDSYLVFTNKEDLSLWTIKLK